MSVLFDSYANYNQDDDDDDDDQDGDDDDDDDDNQDDEHDVCIDYNTVWLRLCCINMTKETDLFGC